MSLTTTINYNDPNSFVFNAADIEIASTLVKLVLGEGSSAFSQAFTSDSGFTYDSAKAEFTGGLVQQKDQTAANSIMGGLLVTKDMNWNKAGAVTGTLNGTPTFGSGEMVCTGSQGCFWDYTTTATESLKFQYTPNYTTGPATNINITTTYNGTNNNDRFDLTNSPSGNNLRLTLYNNVGAVVISLATTLAGWAPTASQKYEFEVVLDSAAGTVRVFVDGVLLGTNSPGAWARGGIASRWYLGASPSAYNLAEGSFDNPISFNNAQHTTTYTPGYTVVSSIYAETAVVVPSFTYAGPVEGSIISFDGLTTTETSTPQYTLSIDGGAHMYWSGSAWTATDGTYIQSNNKSTFSSNLPSFPGAEGALTATVRIIFGDSNTQSNVDQLDLAHTANDAYPTSNPTITTSAISMDGLSTFTPSTTQSGSDGVSWIVVVNGQDKYFNGAAWVNSNGSYAQSSSTSQVSANAASLDLSGGLGVKFKAFLHSGSGTTTPTITSITIEYDFFVPAPGAATKCILYGFETDAEDNAIEGATIRVRVLTPFVHSGRRVAGKLVEATTDADGRWELSVIETASVSRSVQLEVIYPDGANGEKKSVYSIVVPNQSTEDLANLI